MDNKRLVFKRGNQWTKDVEVAPFFAVAGWWRRFMYQVLSAREVVVYCYLCSLVDRNAIAYPTVEQIAADLGIRSRVIVSRGLERLHVLGFILRGPQLIRGRLLSRRPVYQRPHPAHTLLRLLEMKVIDGELFPIGIVRNENDSSHGAVRLGLMNLLGKELYHAYDIATDEFKSPILEAALRQRLEASVSIAKVRHSAVADNLPAEVTALLAANQGIPF
jgi:hypothetical protein